MAKVYELIADDSGVYLLMGLVQGVDLISRVRPGSPSYFEPTSITETGVERSSERVFVERPGRGPLNVERLRDAVGQLASGLLALHASGSIHCDIKPENVLITCDGRVVIVDFGLLTEAVHESRCRWAHEMGNVLSASLLLARRDRTRAISVLEQTTPRLSREGLGLFALAARHRLAVLKREPAAEQAALDEFTARGVRASERFVQALLPLPDERERP